MQVPSTEPACLSAARGGRKNVVTLGMRRCHKPWVGSIGGSRRTLRINSPRILFGCPVLRRQVLGVRRRDVGEKPRGHGGRDRGGTELSQKHARRNRADPSFDGAVTPLRFDVVLSHGASVARVSPTQQISCSLHGTGF